MQFTIAPKAGSFTRPISATYSAAYMIAHNYWDGKSDFAEIPAFGLYAGALNTIALNLTFSDGTTAAATATFTAAPYTDSCNALNNITIIASNRRATKDLSYDYMMLKKSCDTATPTIMDTDGNVRWIGTGDSATTSSQFLNNQFYLSHHRTNLIVMNFDGTRTLLADYKSIGVTSNTEHNFDLGKTGILMDVNTTTETEATDIEVDTAGNVLNTWDYGKIISAAMIAGGDDPSGFVFPVGNDWFHGNAATYNPADNTLIVSSRENFVMALDYDTQQIKWILGDRSKHWYQYPSLRKFALTVPGHKASPIGQHGVFINSNGDLQLFDDGYQSLFQMPPGKSRPYSAPRAYHIDTTAMTATETYAFPDHFKLDSHICGSAYEDPATPNNELFDYAAEDNRAVTEFVGVNAKGRTIFDYKFPDAVACGTSWNTPIIHLENLQF